MRAVTVGALDGVPVVEDRPDPVPGVGEILVEVHAAGLNNADLLQVRGMYPAPPGSPPDIPGMELAGTVVACGPNAARFAVGDRVMAVVGGGAQASLAVVHERMALPVPASVDWPAAGGFPEAFTTAHDALFTQAGIAMGSTVCVHGAAGGVGTAGVQLAVAAGARVVATVRNEALRDAVAAFGAEAVAPDAFAELGPFDAILELIGAPNMPANVGALATGGHIVVIGVGGGFAAEVNLLALMACRGSISASTLRARPLEGKAAAARLVEAQVLPALASGAIRVPVHATFALDEAPAAYAAFAAGGKLGKVVLLP